MKPDRLNARLDYNPDLAVEVGLRAYREILQKHPVTDRTQVLGIAFDNPLGIDFPIPEDVYILCHSLELRPVRRDATTGRVPWEQYSDGVYAAYVAESDTILLASDIPTE